MKIVKSLLFLLFGLMCGISNGQELDVEVQVSVPNIQNADPQIFEDMKKQVTDFMNGMRWTNDQYDTDERIEFVIQFNITTELSANSFRGDVFLQAVRPTYNSSYKTPTFTHVDKDVYIEYTPLMELQNSRDNFFNNLSSLLSFYSYLVLGIDYDSFSPLGGEDHFRSARNIVNLVPPSMADQDKGWKSVQVQRNRFILIEDYLNPRIRPFREAMYNYHRHSLDVMHSSSDDGLQVMTDAIKNVADVNRSVPNAMVLQVFANTKRDELIEIMKKGSSDQKSAVYQVMSRLDPSNISKYRVIRS